jgi:quinol monooxygenase YgiN
MVSSFRQALLATLFLCPVLQASALAQPEPDPIVAQVKPALKDPAKPFTMLVRVQIKEGMQGKFETAFAAAIQGTRKEKGCLAYDLNRDSKDPTRYLVYERWKSLADLEAHLKTRHIVILLAELKDLLAAPPEAAVMVPASE